MKALVVGLLCLGIFESAAQAAKITTIKIDGASNVDPAGINNHGQITGTVTFDGNAIVKGFVRDTDGSITVFDPSDREYTTSNAIDAAGNVSGQIRQCPENLRYCILDAYVRAWDGTTTFFAVGQGQYGDTVPCCVKTEGWIAGSATDVDGDRVETYGFARSPAGTVTPISMPGSEATYIYGMNSSEKVTGQYTVPNSSISNGFIRAFDGTFKTISLSGLSVIPTSINADGAVAGYVFDAQQQQWHGFIRDSRGNIQKFDAPNATGDTIPVSLNDAGSIAGYYGTANGVYGFVRARNGKIRTIAPHGSTNTYVTGMNQHGVIVGTYTDRTGADVGFIRTP